MKRLLTMLSLMFVLAVAASAEVQTIQVNNYDRYGSGSVCYVNPMFNGTFEMVYNDLSTDHTSKGSAVLLSVYFDGGAQRGECRDIKADGSVRIDVPDSSDLYVVVIVTNGTSGRSASLVYWNVYKIDGSISERITVNP